jgi:hypothetical protein
MYRICVFVTILAYSTFVNGREIHVNNLTGEDSLNGLTPQVVGQHSGPVKTLAKAMRIAQAGDRVVMANTGTPYREAFTLEGGKNSGIHSNAPFILEGNGAIVEGVLPVVEHWEFVTGHIFRITTQIKSHQILWLGDRPAERVALVEGKLPSLKPMQYAFADGYLYLCVEADKLPHQYEPLVAGSWTGLTLYNIRNVIIRNVELRGFAFDGLNAHDNVFNVHLENVTCRENGRCGFTIGGSSQVMLDRCLAEQNYAAQVRSEAYAQATLADCTLDDSYAPAVVKEGGSTVIEKTVK